MFPFLRPELHFIADFYYFFMLHDKHTSIAPLKIAYKASLALVHFQILDDFASAFLTFLLKIELFVEWNIPIMAV